LSRADEAGYTYTGRNGKVILYDGKSPLLIANRHEGLYSVRCSPHLSSVTTDTARAHAAQKSDADTAILWHRRFGHIGYSTLAKMSRSSTVDGMPPA
jgi:hypothetical protein